MNDVTGPPGGGCNTPGLLYGSPIYLTVGGKTETMATYPE